MPVYEEQLRIRVTWYFLVIQCFFLLSVSLNDPSVCPEFQTCFCRQNGDKFDIYCYNLTSLSTVEDLLRSDFTQRDINVLSLKSCSVTVLPDSVFDNFSISILDSSCPLREVANNSLTNIRNLKRVILKKPSFSEIPYGLRVLPSLGTLQIFNGSVTHISNELAALTNLRFFTINEGQLELLSEDAFVHTPNIVILDLSYNKLRVIHENTFDPLTTLERIFLRGNMLLSLDGLFKNLNPQIIDVYDNNVTDMYGVFHDGMWRVNTLNIGKNPIPFLNSSAFDNKLQYLKILDISASKYSELDPQLLKKFIRLQEVNLRRNRIIKIPDGFFTNMHTIQRITLSYNNLVTINEAFHKNRNLQSLSLERNIITDIVNAFKNLPQLSTLRMQFNRISAISKGDLDGMPMLQQLLLSYNKIERVDSESFSKLRNLVSLDLSSNMLHQFNYSLKHLYSLKNLTAKSTYLEYIADDEIGSLTKLTKVNLVDNKLKSINGVFKGLSSLTSLNIAKNKLTTLSRDTFPDSLPLKELWLGSGNKWVCDCRLLWLLEWLNGTGRDALKDEPHCHLPKRLFSIPLRNLTALDVLKWPDECPDPCDCECQPDGRDFYVRVNCSKKQLFTVPDVLPDFLGVLDLQDNFIQNVSFSNLELIQNLRTLNLSGNDIVELEQKLPSTLKVLKLDGNKLTRFPKNAIGNLSLDEITLSRNPWICDCETTDFRNWLIHVGKKVLDVKDVRCADTPQNGPLRNSVIRFLKDTDLCPTKISFYVDIGIGTLVLLLVVASIFLAYSHYHLHLKIWLYAHGFPWVKEDDMDTDKLFDAYVCHSPEDEDFAMYTFAPNLEITEPKFKLCIPSRDISCGGSNYVTDSLEGIALSKRFIAIVTKNYLNDQYCLEYLKIAFSMSLEDKTHRIIIVRCEDIPKNQELDPDLKTVFSTTRTLVWEEKMFWEKLRYALPKKEVKKKWNKKLQDERMNTESVNCGMASSEEGLEDNGSTDTQPLLHENECTNG